MSKGHAILSVVTSLSLFLGGIFLLTLRIPVWSLLLGLPSVQIGIVLIIFTFDRLSREEIKEELESIKEGRRLDQSKRS